MGNWSGEVLPWLAPQTQTCPSCNTQKFHDDFHKKGRRCEHICRICSNAKKKKRRDQKRQREKRKRAKNRTLILGEIEIVGALNDKIIEDFGRVYGNLIREVLGDGTVRYAPEDT